MTLAGYVKPKSAAALKQAVARQPISVGIDAEAKFFHSYAGGIISDPTCGETIDHGVLLIGYGHDATLGQDYWLLKNSWGTSWGEGGHFRILRTDDEGAVGICGLQKQSSYPTI